MALPACVWSFWLFLGALHFDILYVDWRRHWAKNSTATHLGGCVSAVLCIWLSKNLRGLNVVVVNQCNQLCWARWGPPAQRPGQVPGFPTPLLRPWSTLIIPAIFHLAANTIDGKFWRWFARYLTWNLISCLARLTKSRGKKTLLLAFLMWWSRWCVWMLDEADKPARVSRLEGCRATKKAGARNF